MAEHELGCGEQYRPRMKKGVAQMGWSELSEEDGSERVASVVARGGT